MLLDRIIRAWKDPEFRLSLSEEEQGVLPENPAGAIELTDDELDMVSGGHHGSSYSSSRSYSSNSASRSYNSNSASRSNNSNSASRSYNSNSASRSNNSNSASRSYNSKSASRSNSSRSSRSYAWRRRR